MRQDHSRIDNFGSRRPDLSLVYPYATWHLRSMMHVMATVLFMTALAAPAVLAALTAVVVMTAVAAGLFFVLSFLSSFRFGLEGHKTGGLRLLVR